MKKHNSFLLLLVLVLCLVGVAGFAAGPSGARQAAPQALSLERWVIGGGGGHTGSGGQGLDYTIGQPVVGVTFGGTTQLGAGFWGGRSFTAVAILLRRSYLPVIVYNH